MSRDRISTSDRPWFYRLAILLGGLFLLTLLHHVYVHTPVTKRIARVRAEIGSAQLKLHQKAQDRARVPKLEHELAQLKQEVEERITEIAQVSDRPVLLAELSQIAQAAGLEILRLRPGEETQREGYVELPVQLGLEGKFHDFLRFLSVLAKIPHLSSLGDLTIVSHSTLQDPPFLDISLEILTYTLPDPLDEHRIRTAATGFDPYGERTVASGSVKPPAQADSLNGLRDPFHAPEMPPCNKALNDLESYALNELRLVGIVWEPREPKGLVMDGASGGHIIIPGSRIGNRGGIVAAITPTHIVVQENAPTGTAQLMSVKIPVFTFNRSARDEQTPNHMHRKRTRTGGSTPPRSACGPSDATGRDSR